MKKSMMMLLSCATVGLAAPRPNILWLTFEDTSDYLVGCYGNPQAQTPVMDSLAARGVRYEYASSVAPQCSPARSAIISGCQPAFWGHDQHRGPREADHPGYLFPKLLRAAGYYCTNQQKTDYNNSREWLRKNLQDAWDASKNDATYNDPARRPDQPFFAVFNNNVSHMNCVATIGRDFRETPRIPPADVVLPPHVPDLPAIRDDYAQHLHRVEQVDQWIGTFLDDLGRRGLADDTIVFVYSDHGGCLPRGKGFGFDSTGFQVPMIVFFPEKWSHLRPDAPGTASQRLVDFTDLGPTVLNLAGVKVPGHMHGQPFLGASVGPGKKFQVNVRSNSGSYFDPVRTVSDGRYSYVRNFIPYKPDAVWQDYQWQMPAQRAWDEHALSGAAEREYLAYYEAAPVEQLFDLQADPCQLRDLAGDPRHAGRIAALRKELSAWMRKTQDKGLVPLQMRERDPARAFFARLADPAFPMEAFLQAAERAGLAEPSDLPAVRANARHPLPEIRFWGAVGLAQLARQGVAIAADLEPLLGDENPDIALAATEALWFSGEQAAAYQRLLEGFRESDSYAIRSLEMLVMLDRGTMDGKLSSLIRRNMEQIAATGGSAGRRKDARIVLTRFDGQGTEEVFTAEDLKRTKGSYRTARQFNIRP